MSVPVAQLAGLCATVARMGTVMDTLTSALRWDDLLTARYAAATLTQLSDQLEAALLDADPATRALPPLAAG